MSRAASPRLRRLACAALLAPALAPAQRPAQLPAQTSAEATLTINPADVLHPVSPTLYGMMTEEINHAFDGGLYADLVNNRTFRPTWSGIDHWDLVRRGAAAATFSLDRSTGPSKALPTSAQLTVSTASPGNEAGLSNTGFWGMAVHPHTRFTGTLYARLDSPGAPALTAQLVSDDTGAILAKADIPLHSGPWARYDFTMTSTGAPASQRNHLELLLAQPASLHLQAVSLMPPTVHNHGTRPDLMERMAALHPNFLRLPGGNYLEGDTLKDWYNWKQTIGPLVDRPGHQAPWTYWSTDGMGLLEFLEWTEDLHIEPVLAVYAGYALHGEHITPGPDLQPFVQSALDEIEYLTGDTSTRWGAERAKDGHPAPFPLHYIEIGNEDEFDKSGSYPARFAQFATALHTRYPPYKLIATTPVKEDTPAAQPDLIDDHFYKPAAEMLDFTHHYDDAPRSGPKIFVGEWATLSGTPTPNFGGALADAAFMTSLERNSDLIVMASYAPLLINVNPGAGQWGTNLIGFDALSTYGSPSYWAQCLFAAHLGAAVVRSSLSGAAPRLYTSVTVGSPNHPEDHTLHLKLVNASTSAQPLTIELQGLAGTHTATVNSLHAATYAATNSITAPDLIHPVPTRAAVPGPHWHHTVPALTIEVIDIPL